ncbi:MAG: hypothetical protein JO362_21105 [Streptomycetaceae bacterium]|nr:hypothetical protein [Streptomycetaceae bacterium]
MTGQGNRPAFGLSFDPRALTDLLQAPSGIRDLALAQLQHVVNARVRGGELTGNLAGYHKLHVDARKAWRIVYTQRPAPANAAYRTEIHVVAVRRRAQHEVYDTARARLGITRRPTSALTHAARTRSPQLTTRPPHRTPAPPAAVPGLPQPALASKGPLR